MYFGERTMDVLQILAIAALVLVVVVNVEYWSNWRKMTPEQRAEFERSLGEY
jgi:hypothetical protein